MSATRTAIYGKMAGDSTLTNLLGDAADGYGQAIYYGMAPGDAEFPYVIFQKQAGTPTPTFNDPDALNDEVWMIKGVDRSESADGAEGVQARLQALLDDGVLSISGKTQRYFRRESDVDYLEVEDGIRFVHAGSLYRLVTE